MGRRGIAPTQQLRLVALIDSKFPRDLAAAQTIATAIGHCAKTYYNRRAALDNLTLGELRALRELLKLSRKEIFDALDI